MADVARVAGVSISTVSHVINETRKVRPQTRDEVLEAIRRTGYTHNTIARALVTASTTSIGLAISVISNPYFGELVHAIEAEASDAGYTLLLGDTHDEAEQELRIVRALQGRRVDGLLLAPSADATAGTLAYLAAQNLPVVLIDRLAAAEFDQVGTENEAPTADLVAHLAGHGHERIAMVSGLAGLSTTIERTAGYRRGLAGNGLDYDPALVVNGGSKPDLAQGAVRTLLALPRPPTALLVGNNAMTIGTMRALREAGLVVPRDIALAAFDDFEWADLFSPRLTTVAQPCLEIGAQAVRLLLSRLADPTLPPRTVRLEPSFRRRESCGCT
ncbi:MAG TPA: LacI family DNA-binding transcriptional regulator [Planosporangium sp.]|nr:LacI family DNA-binding transcriptional regulator [Planosporangium sp.]